MNKFLNKSWLLIIFILLITGIFLQTTNIAYAGTLSCNVQDATTCVSGGGTVILRMSGSTNAHAELPGQSTDAYKTNAICCSGVAGLGNSCVTGTHATVLNLSAATNAHVQQSGSYTQPACISITAGTVAITYAAGVTCASLGYEATLGSMKATTNSHVGDSNAYSEYKICGTATAGTTTLSTGTNPGNATIAPGGAITSVNGFTLTSNVGTDAITAVTVNLSTNSGVGTLTITNGADTVLGSIGGGVGTGIVTGSNSISISSTNATTGGTTFKVKVTPLSHANMPVPDGGAYAVTGVVTDWTGTYAKAGQASDTSSTVTIDNDSPAATTGATATAGDAQVQLSWTNPGDSDFEQVFIYCKTTSILSGDTPAEGTNPTVDAAACDSTARLKYKGTASPQTISGLTNSTLYYFRIYARDTNGNFTAYASTQQVSATPVLPVRSISGIIYTDQGVTPYRCDSNTLTVKLAINGANTSTGDCTTSDGAFSVNYSVAVAAGNVLTLILDGETEKAAVVTRALDGNSLSNIKMYQNRLIVRHEDAGPVTNADLNQYDNACSAGTGDTDNLFCVNNGALNLLSGYKLMVWTGDTFTPGGSVSTYPAASSSGSDGDIDIQSGATLNMGGNNLTVGGDWSNVGTFSKSVGQATFFTSTVSGQTLYQSGTGNFSNLTFAGAGDWTLPSTYTVDHDITIAAGTLISSSGILTVGGSFVNNAIFTHNSGTVTLNSSSAENIIAGASSFNNLTLNNASGTWSLGSDATLSGDLTVTAGTLTGSANLSVAGNTTGNGSIVINGSTPNFYGMKDVGAEQYHGCALSNSGRVYCWGGAGYGNIGDGTFNDANVPAEVIAGAATGADTDGTYLINIKTISVGDNHTCVLSNSGKMYCWGSQTNGEDGNGVVSSVDLSPVLVKKGAATGADTDGTNLINIKAITTGSTHTCALSNSGKTYCWGADAEGQLGNGAATGNKTTPYLVVAGVATGADTDGTNLINLKAISAANVSTCAISNSGRTYCWGTDASGQLGNGATTGVKTSPVLVVAGAATGSDSDGTYLINMKNIETGELSACAISSSGKPYCWGNVSGTTAPALIAAGDATGADTDGVNLINIKSLAVGLNTECFGANSGKVYCIGDDTYGQLGNGAAGAGAAVTLVVKGVATGVDTDNTNLINIKTVTASRDTMFALSNSGATYSWGYDHDNLLGNGSSTTDKTSPVFVLKGSSTENQTLTLSGTSKTFGGTAAWSLNKMIVSGTITASGGVLTLADDFVASAGSFSGTKSITVNGGDVSGNGVINLTGGTFTLDGTPGANWGGNTNWKFGNLIFGTNGITNSYTATGTGSIQVNTLNISTANTLYAGAKTYLLLNIDEPLSIDGTLDSGTSTFYYHGTEDGQTVAPASYYNLKLGWSAEDAPYNQFFSLSGTIQVLHQLNIIQAPDPYNTYVNLQDSVLVLDGAGTPVVISGDVSVDSGTSTVAYEVPDGGITSLGITGFYDLLVESGADNPTTAILSNSTTVSHDLGVHTILSQGASANLTVNGSFGIDGSGADFQHTGTGWINIGGALEIYTDASFNYTGTGTITLGGDVSNFGGEINIDGNAAGCGDSDISITATSPRTWSGGGGFDLTDVALTKQVASVPIIVKSGTNVSGNTGSWTWQECAGALLPASGTLISSVFDTADSPSIGYNSIMWKGTLGGAGENEGKVRFQLAASASPSGPWNFYGGDTCGALDYFDTVGPNVPVELKGANCLAAWNNKRYFRYKVQICSNDCVTQGSNTPTVNDVIVNWSP